MTTAAGSLQTVPESPPSAPALSAADQGVASALEAILSDNTRRVYAAQWRLFNGWCDEIGLRSLPAEPLTVARYLAARAGSGVSVATLRLAMSAIAKAHEWAGALTWGDVQRWEEGSGPITVIRFKTDVEAQGAVVAITPAAMRALDAIRPAGVGGAVKVFGLSESQIARRVKAVARAAGLPDWEFFNGHSGRVGMAQTYGPERRPYPRDRA